MLEILMKAQITVLYCSGLLQMYEEQFSDSCTFLFIVYVSLSKINEDNDDDNYYYYICILCRFVL